MFVGRGLDDAMIAGRWARLVMVTVKDFSEAGLIPVTLIRWQLTGNAPGKGL
jgi:hypothetical protein